MISFVIYFHSSRLDNLNQMLRFLKMRENLEGCDFVLVCQDSIAADLIESVPDIQLINMHSSEYCKSVMCNVGVAAAKHDYVALLDSDRIFPMNYFNRCLKIVKTKSCFVSPRFLVQLEAAATDEEILNSFFECKPQFKSTTNELHKENLFSGSTVFRKLDYQYLGGMPVYIGRSPADAAMTDKIPKHKVVFTNDIELHLFHERALSGPDIVFNGLKYLNESNNTPSQPFVNTCRHYGLFIDKNWKDESCGIVTACNHDYFDGLKLLVASVRYFNDTKYPIVCADMGMTNEQLFWCEQKHVSVISLANCPPYPGTHFDTWEKYLIWIKPFLFGYFRYMLWLDADVVVLNPLDDVFSLIKKDMLVIKHDPQFYNRVLNNSALYVAKNLLIPPDDVLRVNAGVCGFDVLRQLEFITKWRDIVWECFRDANIKRCMHYQDQGCLNYLLYAEGLLGKISYDNLNLNKFYDFSMAYFLRTKLLKLYLAGEFGEIFSHLKQQYPDTTLLHWVGPDKIWKQTDNQFKMV